MYLNSFSFMFFKYFNNKYFFNDNSYYAININVLKM